MRNKILSTTAILACCLLSWQAGHAQKKNDFEPTYPPLEYWDGETTFYTENARMSLDYVFVHKKVDAMAITNDLADREALAFKEGNRFTGDILLKEGVNELEVQAVKKKGKFKKSIRVFYNPYRTSGFAGQGGSAIRMYGTYRLTPELGNNDIIINRYNKKDVDLTFQVAGCQEGQLLVQVENDRNQPVPVKRVGPHLYTFTAQLTDYRSSFAVRAECDGDQVAQRRITVKVDEEIERRLDTAIIFAVSQHEKTARKLGWADLNYSEEDAEALKWILEKKFGFHATIIHDPTWEQMNEAMEGLRMRSWNKLDQLFIFFTGHGYKAPDGSGYLVPSNVGRSLKTLYPMVDLRNQIDNVGCNNVVLCIDACFASSFLERGRTDIPTRRSLDIHHLLSSDAPFRYFIGSAPSNREAPEQGVYNKEEDEADGKYRYAGKKFKVSAFMMSLMEAIEMGEDEFNGSPIPIWYVGRKVEEIYQPKKKVNGQKIYARTARFGTQQDKGFHFINKKVMLQ